MPSLAVARTLVIACILSAPVAAPGLAQDTWTWPERGQNLQVLPADFSPARLSAVMRGFTQALGVRCSHCHMGEEGQPLSTYDFASDARPAKLTARKMYAMLGDINDHLDGVEPSGERVNMWCHTCHKGLPRPQTLSEALGETWAAEGIEATLARYAQLRQKYYGRGAFDSSEPALLDLAERLQAVNAADAVAVLRLNVENFPDSAIAWSSLAEGLASADDVAGAIAAFERSLQLDERNMFARRRIEELRAQQ